MKARNRNRKFGMALAAVVVAGVLVLPTFAQATALVCSTRSEQDPPEDSCEELSASCCCDDAAPATCECSISPAPILPNTALTTDLTASSFLYKPDTARLLPRHVTTPRIFNADFRLIPSLSVFAKHCALLC